MSSHPEIELKQGTEPGRKKLGIEDLPIETQKDIFKHSATDDLIALALVSKHFHNLASARLYRVLKFSLMDIGDIGYGSQISRLTSGLETLVASRRDYAKYIKELQLGVPGPEDRAWRNPSDNVLSGRLLNTLLLLTLKKARALETFKWNLRIELSRPVFKALHDIEGIQHIRIRLQVGSPLYVEPQPLPLSTFGTDDTPLLNPSNVSSIFSLKVMKQSPKPAKASDGPPTFSGFKELSSLAVLDMDTLDYIPELAKCVMSSACTLKRLELSISETLALRARKHGAPQDSDDETDPDIDENENVWVAPPPLPPPPAALGLGPLPQSSEADIRKERLAQENLLARIFGLENMSSEAQNLDKEAEAVAAKPKEDAQKAFLKDLKSVMSKLIIATSSQNGSNFKPQKALDMVEKAAEKYLNAADKTEGNSSKKTGKSLSHGGKKDTTKKKLAGSQKLSAMENSLGAVSSSSELKAEMAALYPSQYASPLPKSSQFAPSGHNKGLNKSPMFSGDSWDMDSLDISIGPSTIPKKPDHHGSDSGNVLLQWADAYHMTGEDPEATAKAMSKGKAKLVDVSEPIPSPERSEGNEDDSDGPGLFDQPTNAIKPSTRLQGEMAAADDIDISHPDADAVDEGEDQEIDDSFDIATDDKTEGTSRAEEQVKSPVSPTLTNGTTVSGDFPQRMIDSKADSRVEFATSAPDMQVTDAAKFSPDQAMQDYVRFAHGLPLEVLALYLIPIKASILARAVDLSILKSITLLNVGPQGGFWSVMAKTNLDIPLQLKSIHTDNVTMSFLSCVSGLVGLTELFILERSTKARVESLAPNTVVGIEDIRRRALKKHMKTLKKLMIKNENDSDHSWDINGKTIRLITARGGNLAELAHLFMQYLSGLKSLHALHVLNFRSDDTCIWVFRELRKFIVDNISHHEDMKIEFLALKDSLSRLARKPPILDMPKPKRLKKGGNTDASDDDLMSDDGVDDDDEYLSNSLRIETIDGYRFSD
ncbi:MAG: hypothetical protein M1830_003810, partial [Pleopsidium flavum]